MTIAIKVRSEEYRNLAGAGAGAETSCLLNDIDWYSWHDGMLLSKSV